MASVWNKTAPWWHCETDRWLASVWNKTAPWWHCVGEWMCNCCTCGLSSYAPLLCSMLESTCQAQTDRTKHCNVSLFLQDCPTRSFLSSVHNHCISAYLHTDSIEPVIGSGKTQSSPTTESIEPGYAAGQWNKVELYGYVKGSLQFAGRGKCWPTCMSKQCLSDFEVDSFR